MATQITTHYYVRKSTIYLRLTLNGKRATISTRKKIDSDTWNNDTERVSGKSDFTKSINTFLNSLLSKIELYCINMDAKDEKVDLQDLINDLNNKGKRQMTLFKAYQYHIDSIEKLVGIDYTYTTVKRYKATFNNLKRYMNDTDIKLSDLNYKFIEDFYTYLKTIEKLQHNSTSKVIKNLVRVIHVAMRNKWLNKNPFEGFSCNYINPEREYLSDTEIETLINKNFAIDRLNKVRDVFIFQVYTGLAYIDMEALTVDNIETDVDGKLWIIINRRKSGERSIIPLLPRAKEILLKYDYKLPVCSNQRMNGYLKEIAELCNIKKKLTTHIGRHTFATTITLSKGVPIETISKMLGHKSISTTQIYAKVIDKKIASDMEKLMQ